MMTDGLAMGAAGFFAYFAVVLILLRVLDQRASVAIVTLTSVVVFGATLAFGLLSRPVVLFWPTSAAYWLPTLTFLLAFGAIFKSISLRILFDLLEMPEQSDRKDAILARYVRQESYEARLRILEADGLAIRHPDGFRLTRKGRAMGRTVGAVQKVFKIERSG